MTKETSAAKSREDFASQLYFSAQRLEQLGRPASTLAVLERICRDNKTWPYQKSRLRTAIEVREFDAAERVLADIDECTEIRAADRNWLDIRRRQVANRPIIEGRIIDELGQKKLPLYQPVKGRILYFVDNSLPYSSSGYATRAHGLLQGMRKIGYDMICVTRPGFPNDTRDIGPEDVTPVNVIDGVPYHHITEPCHRTMAGYGYIMAAAERIEAKLLEFRPELVIAASNHMTSLPPQIAAARLGIPFIYEVRGFWEITRASREPKFRETDAYAKLARLEKISADAADHVFTLTGSMRDEMVKRGVAGRKISLLPNSCNPEQFPHLNRDNGLARALGIPAGVPVIGYIGSFVQYEGLDDLVHAAALLKRRGLDFRLLLVGDENVSGQEKGPTTAAIEDAAAEGGLKDWLIMPGRVPHDKVASYYTLIDIAPFPRKPQLVTEMVSPIKPLEAMAMKKAIVSSSVQALGEMVQDGKTGLLFEKGNNGALADALDRLIRDRDLRHRLGEIARQWVEAERTWPMTAMKASAEIDRVLNERAQAAAAVANNSDASRT